MQKIKIISILAIMSFLTMPAMALADSVVLSMALHGTIQKNSEKNSVNMAVGTVLKAYCGNTTTEIGTVTLTTEGQYGPSNTSLPVNNCQGANIFIQALSGGQLTEKKDTELTFSAAAITEHDINFSTTTTDQPDTPTTPSGLNATVDSQTEVTLFWTDNSNNETGFQVYKDGNLLTTTAANIVTYQATELTAATAYIFKIRAANSSVYSAYTAELSVTTLSTAVAPDGTTGVITATAVDTTEADKVNDSATETVTKGTNADIISNITVVSDLQTLTSISGSSDEIIVAKQAVNLGTASNADTTDTIFKENSVNTAGIVETIVFVPTDTTTSAAQQIAVIIPQLTLITTSLNADIASVEIRPPTIQNSATVETLITSHFSQATAPVSVKAAISIPTSVSGIKFTASDGSTARYIDICMDKSNFTVTDANDVLVYFSQDNTTWTIDSDVKNKTFTDNQFCFQVNHLTSFAGAQANTKTTSCAQSGAPSNASYTAGNVTVTWSGSAWSTAANCAWTCNSGYTQSGSTCIAVGGSSPSGSPGAVADEDVTEDDTTVTDDTVITPTPAPAQEWGAEQLAQIANEAAQINTGDLGSVLADINAKRDLSAEVTAVEKYIKPLMSGVTGLTLTNQYAITNFVVYGTNSTLKLGAGERAGVVNSYKAAYGKLPTTAEQWNDVIKIANGRFPSEQSMDAEKSALASFIKVYKRLPVFSNPNDNAATKIMAYGLRPADRNMDSEKAGIRTFKAIYGYNPSSAIDWDIARAIAYSGATR